MDGLMDNEEDIYTPIKPSTQQHTTTIVLSSHKIHIASPTLDASPQPPSKTRRNKEERRKARKEKKEKESTDALPSTQGRGEEKGEEGRGETKKKRGGAQLHRLPKELLVEISGFLTFEEMFVCARVCKRMSRKFTRMLTSTKHVMPSSRKS